MKRALGTLGVLALLGAPVAAQLADEVPPGLRETLTQAEAREALDRSVAWLVENQREDGSFSNGVMDTVQEFFFSVESFYAWKVAADGLATLALLSVDGSPAVDAALRRAVDRLVAQRAPKRGNHWDTDYGWGVLYAFATAVEAADDPRFAGDEDQARLAATARRYLAILEDIQSPAGGWAYYDDPIYSQRPTWDTSFCTALVLPALVRARARGWLTDDAVLTRAQRYVERCALPNGAYTYDLTPIPRISGGEHINAVKGSLARIQVCNWGLFHAGSRRITHERIREGLAAFFEHHRFLDAARMRPIPHEAYYANAGYFYLFGHYYAAEAIELLPAEEREAWHARLRPHLVRTIRDEGYALDFIDTSYQRVAGTAFVALGLALGLPETGDE